MLKCVGALFFFVVSLNLLVTCITSELNLQPQKRRTSLRDHYSRCPVLFEIVALIKQGVENTPQ